jgi:hypothetical protein
VSNSIYRLIEHYGFPKQQVGRWPSKVLRCDGFHFLEVPGFARECVWHSMEVVPQAELREKFSDSEPIGDSVVNKP